MENMEQPYTRLKTSSIIEHPGGAISFELEVVPYKQAYEEAMLKTWETLAHLYEQNPASFKFSVLNLGSNERSY